MKDMIQTKNFVAQFINILEAQMSQLINAYRNEKTLPYQFLTNLDISNAIVLVTVPVLIFSIITIILVILNPSVGPIKIQHFNLG